MTTTRTYTARCERDHGWWVATVDDLDGIATQARRLDQLAPMVSDLIAAWLDVEADSFDVHLEPVLDSTIEEEIARARRLRAEANQLQGDAAEASRRVARGLSSAGLTLRDIGVILGVSHQR